MSTIEDFENAPVCATATSPYGHIAFKTGIRDFEWSLYDSYGWFRDNRRSDEMVGFTLNPTAPTTSQEALDLAWELAHPVKEGQIMPSDTRYLLRHGLGYSLEVSLFDLSIDSIDAEIIRTLDPLPDWTNAPAVLADCDCNAGERTVHVNYSEIAWTCTDCDNPINPEDMKNVTPLYPKGQEA